MRRIAIVIASALVFIITATARADDSGNVVTPIVSPLVTPHAAYVEKPRPVNPWAFIWIRWMR